MPSFHDEALSYCRWLTRSARSHFGLGIALLPSEKRKAMEVVYAFCRAVDDVADRDGRGEEIQVSGTETVPDTIFLKRAKMELTRWQRELDDCHQGFPTHPIGVALKPVLSQYQIPLDHLSQLIAGVEMDLTPRRYRTFEELRVYCERVASAVGLISIRVFGCRHPASRRYAVNLGIALQLTNILRDLKADGKRGRVYLPLDEIERFRYSEKDLFRDCANDSFQALMAFQCKRARDFFKQAHTDLKESQEDRLLFPARIMGGVYERLLDRIQRQPAGVFSGRVSVPWNEQLWIAARNLI